MALSALIIPVFLLLAALILDVGNWYTHKRALQNRADAGALAAGVEYANQFVRCSNPATATAAAASIVSQARQYAGAAAGDYNEGVNDQANVTVAVNATGPGAVDNSSGFTPCQPHLTGDAISDLGWIGTDVIVQESNIGTLGRSLGIGLPSITARARVEVNEMAEGDGFAPLAIPEQSVAKARIRFVDDCTGNEIASSPLSPLTSQTEPGMTLWGPDPSGLPGRVTLPLPSTVPVPVSRPCGGRSEHDDERDYTPIRVELRLAGAPGIDLSSASCAALQSTSSADCYPSISQIRVYREDGGLYGDRPQIRSVELTPSGSRPCVTDVYYARTTASPDCTFDASVFMDWGSRPTDRRASFTATIQVGNGPTRTLSGPRPQGTWRAFQVPIDRLGPDDVRVTWRYVLRGSRSGPGEWPPGGLSGCTRRNPCVQQGTTTVHQANLADDPTDAQPSPTDIVGAVKLTTGSSITTTELHQGHTGSVITPYVTVGLRTVFQPGTWSVLRLNEGSRSFSAVCDPYWTQPSTGDVRSAFYFGCQPPYAPNDTSRSWPWWSTGSQSCPPAGSFLQLPSGAWPNQTYTNSPWRCIELSPNGIGQATADGLALATGNCTASAAAAPGIGAAASCAVGTYRCNNPATYSGTGSPPSLSDPRVVKVFVVPWNAYKGPRAGNSAAVPVLRLAAFYVTAWKFGSDRDPCASAADLARLGPGDGKVGGYFVKAVESSGLATSTEPCRPNDVNVCQVTLTR